jgi:EAL domain-containing protein (putative c-di-GMP-specific phosphodiesterase class I)
MSEDGFSHWAEAAAGPARGEGAPETPVDDAEDMTLRRQVLDIIDAVLADPDTGSGWAREQLRGLLESSPGDPEGALLKHLMLTRIRTDPPAGAPGFGEESLEDQDRLVRPRPVRVRFSRRTRERIEAVLAEKLLLTAFQPITRISAGKLVGVEALTRFVTYDGASADIWFREAAAVGLGPELELAALHCAVTAAREVPDHLFIALNLTPATCCEPRVREMLEHSELDVDRIVIELTGSLEATRHLPLMEALEPLRRRGARLAISASAAGSVSMDQITRLHPEIIKLERVLIEGIHDSPGQLTRVAAIADLARQVGAVVSAEGIEIPAELAAVKALGVETGQGYLLGRPSVHPLGWSAWAIQAETEPAAPGSRTPSS